MRRVWKYPVSVAAERAVVRMPAAATVVSAILSPSGGHVVDVYADVTDDSPMRQRVLAVHGTGHPVPAGLRHVASVFDNGFVWHVFDGGQHPLPVHPECVSGKHGNCDRTAWNDLTDDADECCCECHR